MEAKINKGSPLALLPKQQASAAVEALKKLADENDGALVPADVVEAARDKNSPLHACFEWDDSIAGARFREQQARQIIRSVYIVGEPDEKRPREQPMRVFVSSTLTDDENADRYVPLARVKQDDPLLGARRAFINELDSLLERFRPFRELAAILEDALERVIEGQDKTKAPVREMLKKWDELHLARFKAKAGINHGKDGALLADLWRQRQGDPVTVEMLMTAFFKSSDPFVVKAGFSVGVFRSQIPKLIPLASRQKQSESQEYWEDECKRTCGGACQTAYLHSIRRPSQIAQ